MLDSMGNGWCFFLECSAFILLAGCESNADLFATGGAGGTSTSSSGGTASGGNGTGGSACVPNLVESCYSGPAETEGVGTCKAGLRACDAAGTGFGPCRGEVTPAREECATPQDEDCNGIAESCTPGATVWAKKFGNPTPSEGAGEGVAIASDSAGNVLVFGNAGPDISFGGATLSAVGSLDVVLAKLNPSGAHLWSKRFGYSAHASDMAVAPDGSVWITGYFSAAGIVDFGGGPLVGLGSEDNLYIAKFDPQGAHLFSARYEAGPPMAIDVDALGAVFVTGQFQQVPIDFGGGPLVPAGGADIFVVKFTAQGSHVWSKAFGNSGSQIPDSLDVDASGNVIVAGQANGQLSIGGAPLPPSGAFVAKFTSNGDHVWSQGFGGSPNTVVPIYVAAGPSNNVFLAGGITTSVSFGGGALPFAGGTVDAFLAKLSPSGSHLWSKSFGSAGVQQGTAVACDGAENVLFSIYLLDGSVDLGGGSLTSAGGGDVVLAKLTSAGDHAFSIRAGDTALQLARGITADPSGYTLATGRFSGTLDFGTGPLTSLGNGFDLFVVKLEP
jgi:hypothetical protein